jgi:hypothetical protein
VGNFNLNRLMQRRNMIYISRAALWRTCNFNIKRATSWWNFDVKYEEFYCGGYLFITLKGMF